MGSAQKIKIKKGGSMHCYSELLVATVEKEFVDVIKDRKLKAAFNIKVR
jgi:hypothetical protein